ncbi:TolC family protein [bacterium]|nr:TolC family protein [bacterium]
MLFPARKLFKNAPIQLMVWGIFLFLSFSLLGEAVTPKQAQVILTKERLVALFQEKTGLVAAAHQKVLMAEADYKKVLAVYFPEFNATIGVGPYPKKIYHPTKVYDNVQPDGTFQMDQAHWETHEGDFSEYGFALRARVSFILPVYTFGKFVSGRDATRSLVSMRKSEAMITKLKVREYALTLYYSWLMAHDIKKMIDGAVTEVAKAEAQLKDALYEEKEGVTQKDLIRLRIEKEKLLIKQNKINFDIKTLTQVFDDIIGQPWVIEQQYLEQESFDRTEEQLLEYLATSSPYINIAKSGVNARYNLYRLELYKLLPDLGIVGYYSFKYTSSVDDDNYPSPNSPYNSHDGEFGIGLRFNLNFVSQYQSMKKAKAEWEATKLQVAFMKQKTKLDVQRNINQLSELDSALKHVKKAHKYAKGWMTMEISNHSSSGEFSKDLIDAFKAFMEQEYQLIKTTFDYNMKIEQIKTMVGE